MFFDALSLNITKRVAMKILIKILFVLAVFFLGINAIKAQTTRKERQAEKVASINKMVNDTSYVFEANYADPMNGGQKVLTSEYDLKITRDTVTAFLPYYGRAYMAPNTPDVNEGGIKFTSTNFSYKMQKKKNGTWSILIKKKDTNLTDWRDVQSLTLDISPQGYASLEVISTNRDPISFDGNIEKIGER